MRPRFLVVRSGDRPFPADAVPGVDVVERRSHAIETLPADAVTGPFDLAIFTSQAAADRFLARDDLLSTLPGRILAVGPATAERFRSGLSVEVEEGGGSVRRMLRTLPSDLSGARVLLPRGDDAGDELPRVLTERGAEVVSLLLYRKVAVPYDAALDASITAPVLVAFCATSPSAARWLFAGAAPEARDRLRGTPGMALGEPTARTLVSRGVSRVEIAAPPTFQKVAAMAADLAARSSRA